MPVAAGVYAVSLCAWHVPVLYQAALEHPLVHDLEHLAFFGSAVLFWWPIVNPAPRLHRLTTPLGYGVRIAYLLGATALNTLLGAILGLTERVLYPAYAAGSGIEGWGPLDDQAFGGGVMWSGSHMYLVAILVLLGRALGGEAPAPDPMVPDEAENGRAHPETIV
jgi:cytochrome c oxidase assembly factor CtaG